MFNEKDNAGYEIRKKYGLSTTDKILIFVGRLSVEKGIDKLLEAVQLIKNTNVKVLIVGSIIYNTSIVDDYQNKLRKLAEAIKDNVIFTGYVAHEELPKVYSSADIAVLPSMWNEPAGLTMLEAMACGIPVITTEAGGIPEYLTDSAILLRRDNDLPKNIAKAIDDLLNDSEKYKAYRIKGINRINQKFTASEYLKNFIENLKNCFAFLFFL